MKLECLARRQPQRLAAVCPAEFVELEPLRRTQDATRQPDTRHEGEGRLQFLAPTFIPDVTVILLIDAVKFHQLGVVRGHCTSDRIKQALSDRAAQLVAVRLERFVRTELLERLRNVPTAVGRRQCGRHYNPQ